MAVVLPSKPGPPPLLAKGIVAAIVIAGMVAAGVGWCHCWRTTPSPASADGSHTLHDLLRGADQRQSVAMVLVIAFAMMPVGASSSRPWSACWPHLAVGVAVGTLVGFISSAFFRTGQRRPLQAASGRAAAAWIALRATLIVMPVFVLR